MNERPILFNGPMVRAILDGRKTQTRRILPKFQRPEHIGGDLGWRAAAQHHPRWGFAVFGDSEAECAAELQASGCCPQGKPGDRLWVRETTEEDCTGSLSFARYSMDKLPVLSRSAEYCEWWYSRRSCPSIHMPRWASRITLEITDVRVERLQDISDEDAIAEGVHPYQGGWSNGLMGPFSHPVLALADLIDSVNGPGTWDANPWVWVVQFTVLEVH